MSALAWLTALLQAIAEVAPIIRMSMETRLKNDQELQAAKADLLNQWKSAYASQDLSAVVDALRRLRQSQ